MNFDERIVTDAPPAGAFLYLSDLTNAPSWDPNITRVEQLTPGPIGLGARFRVTMRLVGIPVTLDYHVEVYEPDRRVILIGRGLAAMVTDTLTVTPFRGGSRVRWISEIHLFAPLVLLDPVLSILIRPTVTRAVASLKHSLNKLAPSQATRVMSHGDAPEQWAPPLDRGADGHHRPHAHH
jgi:hypothetical protein